MSIRCVHWALNDAPVAEPVQVLILVAMAERAADDGSATYQSVATIASKARISVRTCQRHLQVLEDAGLISRGDQGHVDHLTGNRRPVVYDLNIKMSRGAILAPQETGVPNDTVRGAKSEARGAKQDTLGVPLMADNSSSNSSLQTRPKTRPQGATVSSLSIPLPSNFDVTAEMLTWAVDKAPLAYANVILETEKFKAYHESKGTRFKDWPAAWRNWMANAQTYAARDAARTAPARPAGTNSKLGLDYGGW